MSFKFLRTVDFKAFLKICIFEKNLSAFESRLKLNLMQMIMHFKVDTHMHISLRTVLGDFTTQ